MGPDRRGIAMLGAAALFVLVLYLLTMPPGLTWWFGAADSGDLAAAAYTLGIPHPTGYPLYTLLGWLATRVPLGEPALRLNVLNALTGAATVIVTGLIIMRVARPEPARAWAPAAAVASVLPLAASDLFWSQAIVTEVYMLNLLLCAVVALLLLRGIERPGTSLLLGLAQGLALANHVTSVFALVATVAALASARRRPALRETVRYAAGLALGLSLYLLLPLRASQNPPVNWGDPDTPGRFLRHVTGGDYGGRFAWTDLGGNLRAVTGLVRLLLGDIALWALPAAVYGAARLWGGRAALPRTGTSVVADNGISMAVLAGVAILLAGVSGLAFAGRRNRR